MQEKVIPANKVCYAGQKMKLAGKMKALYIVVKQSNDQKGESHYAEKKD